MVNIRAKRWGDSLFRDNKMAHQAAKLVTAVNEAQENGGNLGVAATFSLKYSIY